ncbi:MAG: zinc-binding dehydrogenase [Myxococcales bacterium]|nr:zinc-binding dehydrogenase [Myxococcales bacterium]
MRATVGVAVVGNPSGGWSDTHEGACGNEHRIDRFEQPWGPSKWALIPWPGAGLNLASFAEMRYGCWRGLSRRSSATDNTMGYTSRQLQSTINEDATLKLALTTEEVSDPGPDEVIVRIEASPLNPSDLGLLFGPADLGTARAEGSADDPVVIADVPKGLLSSVAGRLGKPMAVGNEGGGVVVAAGGSELAQSLLGKTVGVIGGAMYSQYRKLHVGSCLALPEGITPRQGASCFVNPLTALGMLETLRAEGHSALVHTAAASNLGQMLVKLCQSEGVPLVNVVRRPAQAELLRALGASHVVDSSADSFRQDLVAALGETDATLAFDATGGGELASQILSAMEAAQNAKAQGYSRYGSSVHKQVYIYGGLDRSPTVLKRSYGMAWGVGGWLLTPLLQKLGAEGAERLRARVASEITTTFSSHYTKEVSLAGALALDAIAVYGKQATGEKYLINPSL